MKLKTKSALLLGAVILMSLPGAGALAAGTTGILIDTEHLAVGVAHCEEEDVSRNGARTAQVTGALDVSGAIAAVSITCKVIQSGVVKVTSQLSLPGNTVVAPTTTGTISNTGAYLVCGYGGYTPILSATQITFAFSENVSGCPLSA